MWQRLSTQWVYGGALASLVLFAVLPIVFESCGFVVGVCFACLPVYMLHQLEEHDRDRFRRYFNATIGGGREVLSHTAVLVTNVPGVWGVITLSTVGCFYLSPDFVFVPVYLVVVNAAFHIANAAVLRGYNPGLATAVLLFLPVGGIAFALLARMGIGDTAAHLAGFAVALAIHVVILVHVARVRARLRSGSVAAGT